MSDLQDMAQQLKDAKEVNDRLTKAIIGLIKRYGGPDKELVVPRHLILDAHPSEAVLVRRVGTRFVFSLGINRNIAEAPRLWLPPSFKS